MIGPVADQVSSYPSGLSRLSSAQWLHLSTALIHGDPELARQFRFLELILAIENPEALRKHTQQFIGASKCPSVSGCERLARRTRWLMAILQSDLLPPGNLAVLMQAGLEKLLPACEGADDRNSVFRPAVRDFVQKGLQFVSGLEWDATRKVEMVFELALVDQCTLVEPIWWWNHLLRTDEAHALKLAGHRIENLALIEPSTDRTWKTLGGRWTRLRLKSFLEHAQCKPLLAELMSKSAVDDFEASQAVELLRQIGRGRDALALAERWNRLVPASSVLGFALTELYLEDGWDEEALELARWHYERDPHPRWLPLIRKAAGPAWSQLKSAYPDD